MFKVINSDLFLSHAWTLKLVMVLFLQKGPKA